jgi:hypothetical protein
MKKQIILPSWYRTRREDEVILRALLKRTPEYHIPVELNPRVEGWTEDGVPIPINTLGRWLFGVPGYAGNATFDGFKDVSEVVVNANGISDDVVELIDRLFCSGRRSQRKVFIKK